MGSIYGAKLSKTNEVYLIGRNSELVDLINNEGLTLVEEGEENRYYPKAALSSPNLPKMDLVLLFVKAYATKEVLEKNKNLIGEETVLMVLQNGGGYEDILSSYAPGRYVIGTTEDNGTVLAAAKVRHGGVGRTNLGSPCHLDLSGIKQAFDASLFDTLIHENINSVIWHKLIINASMSVLTGVLGCESSYIARNENAWSICSHLVEEIVRTAAAIGLSFSLPLEIERVRATSLSQADAYTSIATDVKNGRKTEVDFISGYVLRVAKENNIFLPYTDMAVSLIHVLEMR